MAIKAFIKKTAPPGDLPETYVQWQGPASYTQITLGPPVGGGDQIPSGILGVSGIISVDFQGCYGQADFSVVPIRVSEKLWILKWIALRTATIGGQSQTIGTEAAATTNLSAEYVTVQIISRGA